MAKFENVSPDGELMHRGLRVALGAHVEVEGEEAERFREQPRNWREVVEKPAKKSGSKPEPKATETE